MTLDAFPRKMTKTAQQAAVAEETSYLLAFVNIEQDTENTRVDANIVPICDLLRERTWSGSFG